MAIWNVQKWNFKPVAPFLDIQKPDCKPFDSFVNVQKWSFQLLKPFRNVRKRDDQPCLALWSLQK